MSSDIHSYDIDFPLTVKRAEDGEHFVIEAGCGILVAHGEVEAKHKLVALLGEYLSMRHLMSFTGRVTATKSTLKKARK